MNSDTLDSLSNFVTTLSGQAAGWYRGITGAPVVTPAAQGTIPQQYAIGQQTQLQLAQTHPVTAALTSNPLTLVLLVGGLIALVVLLVVLFRK